MRHRLAATIVATLVVALAAFTGTSLAGNGNGQGGGTDHGQSTSGQPAQTGNSDKQSSTSPTSPATGGSNAQGVKPSSSTKHDTYAKASSDKTKQYGNGQTAGQIATKSGHGDATLHGPGNSQPHKASCGPHEVDVHALKNKSCGSGEQPASHETKAHATKSQSASHESTHATVKHEEKQKQEVSKPEVSKPEAPKMAHVTICHATGSATNPFVRISPSVSGVYHGHLGHQDARDIVPPFSYGGQSYSQNWDASGQAMWNAGCAAPAAPQTQAAGAEATKAESPCGTTTQTVTEQVLVGVKHFVGPKGSGRYVVIHPSANSAHYTGKHPDDVPLYETVTKTIAVPAASCSSSETQASTETKTETVTTQTVTTQAAVTAQAAATATQSAAVAGTAAASTPATPAPAPTAAPAGAVKGAVVTLKPASKPKAAGGVLGATTRLGRAVTGRNLPFTGLPLWIFAAIAAGAILAGVAMRRSAADRA